MAEETVILDFEVDEGNSIQTLEALTKANKALREERKKLDLDSVEGQKRVQQINAQLDKNTAKIKENVSALEKQKINIGNYKSALEGVVPGLSNVTQGVEKASGAVKLFRLALGPIGILLGIIAGALALLTKFLFGTQEGMDKVTAVTRPLLAVLSRLGGLVEDLGGRLFKALGDAIRDPIQALKDLGNAIVNNKAFTGLAKILTGDVVGGFKDLKEVAQEATKAVGDFFSEAIDQGTRLDQLQKQIERAEINRITRFKELELIEKRNKGIVEDETKSLAEREAAAIKARNAQNQNEKEALELLDLRIEKLRLQQSLNDTSREDEKELADLVAQRLETQARTAERAIEFDKKLNELRKKQREELDAQEKDAIARSRAGLTTVGFDDPLVKAFQTRANLVTNIAKRMQDELTKINADAEKERLETQRKNALIAEQVEQEKFAIIGNLTNSLAGLAKENSIAGKALASAGALINTYAASVAALKSGSEINPLFGILSAAAAIANGLNSVAKINNVEFAEGGWTGPGSKYQPAGIVHADEYVTPKHVYNNPAAKPHINALENMRLRGYADGGLVTSSVSNPINQQLEISNIMKNLPPQVVSVEEFNRVAKRVAVKEQFSRR